MYRRVTQTHQSAQQCECICPYRYKVSVAYAHYSLPSSIIKAIRCLLHSILVASIRRQYTLLLIVIHPPPDINQQKSAGTSRYTPSVDQTTFFLHTSRPAQNPYAINDTGGVKRQRTQPRHYSWHEQKWWKPTIIFITSCRLSTCHLQRRLDALCSAVIAPLSLPTILSSDGAGDDGHAHLQDVEHQHWTFKTEGHY